MNHVKIRVSKDGARNWGAWKLRGLGVVGDFLHRVVLRRLGISRQFIVDISVTDPVRCDIIAASVQIEGEG